MLALFSAANARGTKLGWAAGIFKQIVEATAYLHSQAVIHGDLKESNVMVCNAAAETPAIVLIDFGLAYHFHATSALSGTPGYIPPEVWVEGLWTPKGDVTESARAHSYILS